LAHFVRNGCDDLLRRILSISFRHSLQCKGRRNGFLMSYRIVL
jgi:hypothetical protein